VARIRPFATALVNLRSYVAGRTEDISGSARSGRPEQWHQDVPGSTAEGIPEVQSDGLDEWIKTREANTNDQARKLIDAIEKRFKTLSWNIEG